MVNEDIKFSTLKELIDKINTELADFTNTFRYKRKELTKNKRAPSRGILFKYDKEDRDWAINEGGGTEIQYHIYFRDDSIGYGLGFNTQYVPHANEMSSIEYMRPFVNSFLSLSDTYINNFNEKGFDFIYGSKSELYHLENDQYILFGKQIPYIDNKITASAFNTLIFELKNELFDLYCKIFEGRNQILEDKIENMDYINLLYINKNIILTGAPGTGKTYLAKEIAKKAIGVETDEELELSNQYSFVQFHPSYDYTDFVEGLRPVKKDSSRDLGFELRDGIFKMFCKNALTNLIDSRKSEDELAKDDIASKNIVNFLDSSIESSKKFSLKNGNEFEVIAYDENYIDVVIPGNQITSSLKLPIKEIKQLLVSNYELKNVKDVRTFFRREHNRQSDSYIYTLYIDSELSGDLESADQFDKVDKKNFVFVIDEINRGEISKIFGELFFSIDPGYRGEKGKVKTQYTNLHNEEDLFFEGFYVPENVYIIGTMNDIDRSVESMDFAMRRRFAWKEIKVKDRISMLSGLSDEWKKETEQRMNKLNSEIDGIQELGSAYNIGPAYFLKLENYIDNDENPFSRLWNNHLEGVIFEYLRGLPNSVDLMKKLESAYNLEENVENN